MTDTGCYACLLEKTGESTAINHHLQVPGILIAHLRHRYSHNYEEKGL